MSNKTTFNGKAPLRLERERERVDLKYMDGMFEKKYWV